MENLYEWWQLFDPTTCRYYYYNINNQRTTWHLPVNDQHLDKSSSMSSLCAAVNAKSINSIPLASRLVSLLIKNHTLLNNTSTNDLKILYDNMRRDGIGVEGGETTTMTDSGGEKILKTFLNKNLSMIQSTLLEKNDTEEKRPPPPPPAASLTQSLIKTKPTSIVSVPLNAAMSSLTNLSPNTTSKYNSIQQQPITNTGTSQRRLLPRTNPNYVNVDLIDSNNGKTTIKNTYVKLQDLNCRNEKENNNKTDQHVIMTTSAFNSLRRPTHSLTYEEKAATTTSTNETSDLYNQATLLLLSILKNTEKEKTIKKNFQSMSNISLNVNKTPNSDDIIIKADEKSSITGTSTISKKSGKKFSYFTSKLTHQNSNAKTPTSSNHAYTENIDYDDDNKSLHTTKNNGTHANTMLENANIYNSISTTSISDMRNLYQKKQSQLNQKFQTLRRSFNTKTSLTKMQANDSIGLGMNTTSTPASNINKILNKASSNNTLATPPVNSTNNNISPTSSMTKSLKKNSGSKKTSKKDDVLFDLLNSDHFKKQQQQYSLNIKEGNCTNSNNGSSSGRKEFLSPESPTFLHSYISSGQSPPQFILTDDQSPQAVLHHSGSSKSNFSFFTRKKIEQKDIMTWSPQPLQKPLIKTKNKLIKKEACELFKLIQEYMGDKNSSSSSSSINIASYQNQFNNNSNNKTSSNSEIRLFNQNFFLNNKQNENNLTNNKQVNHQDFICLEIIRKGWQYAQLRDELFLQLVKQTTLNLNPKSFLIGWQLIAICLTFFPPSQKLYPFFFDYINYHSSLSLSLNNNENENENECVLINDLLDENDETGFLSIDGGDMNTHVVRRNEFKLNRISNACKRRLERINVTGAKKGLKMPQLEEILLSKYTILNPSLFGSTLNEIMGEQQKKCPLLNLPWIQTTLSEAILRMNGAKTEGIFRVPGDLDEVNNLKVYFEQMWCTDGLFLDNSFKSINDILIDKIHDPHLPASLLKLWYRELHEPLIPDEYYNECIQNCENPSECIKIIEKLPQINKLVFNYLIRFFKVFAASENVAITKMDANNLSMIMAPNCLRCKSNEAKVIMENTKKEMQFIKTLIQNLDTSIVQGVV